jgi:hypothetical protein
MTNRAVSAYLVSMCAAMLSVPERSGRDFSFEKIAMKGLSSVQMGTMGKNKSRRKRR